MILWAAPVLTGGAVGDQTSARPLYETAVAMPEACSQDDVLNAWCASLRNDPWNREDRQDQSKLSRCYDKAIDLAVKLDKWELVLDLSGRYLAESFLNSPTRDRVRYQRRSVKLKRLPQDRLREAMACINEPEARLFNRGVAWADVAMAYRDMGRPVEARDIFLRIKDDFPDSDVSRGIDAHVAKTHNAEAGAPAPALAFLEAEKRRRNAVPESPVILLVGDSTVITSYYQRSAPEVCINAVLQRRLRAAYGDSGIKVINVGRDGETAKWFLKRYEESVKSKYKRVDVAFIRYGLNDIKKHKGGGWDVFRATLPQLCDRIKEDYPDCLVVLETVVPRSTDHLSSEAIIRNPESREARLAVIAREIAEEKDIPLLDIWELSCLDFSRGIRAPKLRCQGPPRYLTDRMSEAGESLLCGRTRQLLGDNRFDYLIHYGTWYSDVHQASGANGFIADQEYRFLRQRFPDKIVEDGVRRR